MLLECRGVTKSYGNKKVLDGIDLVLEKGRIIGLLGKNGTGKSTLLKLINGLLTLDGGQITFQGESIGVESKRRIAFLPERTYLDKSMTVHQVIAYFSDFYDNFDAEKARKLLKDLSLDESTRLQKMSKGGVAWIRDNFQQKGI